jgi:hypothetical protein
MNLFFLVGMKAVGSSNAQLLKNYLENDVKYGRRSFSSRYSFTQCVHLNNDSFHSSITLNMLEAMRNCRKEVMEEENDDEEATKTQKESNLSPREQAKV